MATGFPRCCGSCWPRRSWRRGLHLTADARPRSPGGSGCDRNSRPEFRRQMSAWTSDEEDVMNRFGPTGKGIPILAILWQLLPAAAIAQNEQYTVNLVSLGTSGVDTTYVTLGWYAPDAFDNWNW